MAFTPAKIKQDDGQKRLARAASQQRGQKLLDDNVIEYCDHTVQLVDRLPQGKAIVKV